MGVATERQHRVIELFCILTLSTSNPVMILQNSFARHYHLRKLIKSTDDLYLISYKCICFYNYLKIKSLNKRERKKKEQTHKSYTIYLLSTCYMARPCVRYSHEIFYFSQTLKSLCLIPKWFFWNTVSLWHRQPFLRHILQ